MSEKKSPLRLRMAKSTPLQLNLEDDGGATFTKNFRISFDFNAISLIEEMTRTEFRPDGLGFLNGEIWRRLNATNLSIMLFAGILAQHPEYNTLDEKTDEPTMEGLGAIRSYMDPGNVEQITRALNEAFMIALPKEKREEIERQQRDVEEAKAAEKAAAGAANPTPAGKPDITLPAPAKEKVSAVAIGRARAMPARSEEDSQA